MLDFKDPPVTNYNSGFGFFFEGLIGYQFQQRFSIAIGLNFNQYRIKVLETIGVFDEIGFQSLNDIRIPVFINMSFNEKIPLSFGFGSYAGLIISAKEKGTGIIDTASLHLINPNDPFLNDLNPEYEYNNNIKYFYKDFDFGLIFQVNSKMNINEKVATNVFIRYNYGLQNVLKKDISYKWKNRFLNIGLGLRF